MKIVLASLKKVTAYARENNGEFYRFATENGELEAEKILKESEIKRSEYASRVKQLDNNNITLYEDRGTGRITPERYDVLASGYEQEQSDLKSKLSELESQLDIVKLRENCIKNFIEKARQYVEMPVLTPELIKVFIKRSEVFEKTGKYSRTCGNRIVIYFTFQADKGIKIDSITGSNEKVSATKALKSCSYLCKNIDFWACQVALSFTKIALTFMPRKLLTMSCIMIGW